MAFDAAPGLAKRMETEWNAIAAAPSSTRRLRGWSAAEPALAEWTDLRAVRTATEDRSNPARSDSILAALARLAAHDGGDDSLAARVLLQLLLPGAVRLARRLRGYFSGDPMEAEATVLAELSLRIRTYPWQRRPARIAANLLLDTHHEIAHQHRREGNAVVGLDPSDLDHHADPAANPADNREQADIIDLFSWATRTHVLTPEQALVLAANRVDEESIGSLAAKTGRSQPTLFRLRLRAEQQLRDHLWEYAAAA